MFKSVFAQYIVAFALIVLVSFTLLLTTVGSIMANYSYDVKTDIIDNASSSADEYITELMKEGEYTDARVMLGECSELVDIMLGALTPPSSEITVVISDADGKVIVGTGKEEDKIVQNAQFPQAMIDAVDTNGEYRERVNTPNVLPGMHMIRATAFSDASGENAGYIMIISASSRWENFFSTMIKAVIISCLWIMLATLIAVYFISERVTEPLRHMSKTVKSYAMGNFEARVAVTGRDEVSQLAIAFNDMADSLENLEKLRNGFVANLSHDLRTPMATIVGFIDGIIDGVIPPEKHEYYLGIVSTEVRRLSRLVSTLLDISKIEAGDRKFVMQPFDICEMGRQIIISLEQKIEAKKLDVEFEVSEDSIHVLADHDAIYQVFYNLCENAVKFAKEGGKYRLCIKEEKAKKISVRIYNEGEGIPAEDIPFVFERFYKSDKSRGLDKSGLGLGLYISKTIIKAHDESISVESEQGKYCEFTFTLTKTSPLVAAEQ